MTYRRRLLVAAIVSVLGHLALAGGARRLPPRPDAPPPTTVEVRVVDPPPPEPKEPPPEEPEVAAKPPPKEVPKDAPPPTKARPSRVPSPSPSAAPTPSAPTERPSPSADPDSEPVFGASMESTSQGGSGPEIATGNTLQAPSRGPATKAQAAAAPLAGAPAEAYEVAKMPLPQGRCSGRYTDEARAAAVEGTVVLDLTVGEDGRTRDIQVVSGLGHGLTEAAVAALRGCRFTPGERSGKRVSVRVRGFKIRFFLADGG